MKRLIVSVFGSCLMLAAFAQKEIVNDANAEARTLSGSFNSIKISGGIDLFLSQGDNESAAVSASEQKFKDDIKTVIENNVLRIYYDGDRGLSWNKSWKNKKMRVYVSFKNIEKIEASGACDVQVAGVIKAASLLLNMSGASDFKGKVQLENLKMELSGASDVKIGGTATAVKIESSGASDVKGDDLITDFCTAKASGASDISITVNKEITASASGASDINYRGNAQVKDKHASGASSVNKKG
jgi:Putative auto-transporter adhesin, head GIN domain